MKCKCGFTFAGIEELRNCETFLTDEGKSGVICPNCDKKYVDGCEVDNDNDEPKLKSYRYIFRKEFVTVVEAKNKVMADDFALMDNDAFGSVIHDQQFLKETDSKIIDIKELTDHGI